MADDIPPVLQTFLEEHLEKPEGEQIIKQFELTWVPEKQILWTGMAREVAQGWADRNNMQTLTTAMGPLMDKDHPLCTKSKGKKRWTKYVHGASALFAWRISMGESVTVLSRPPPERFHPSNSTSFQVIELPIITGKLGNRSLREIRIIHPDRPETTGFSYQLWPLDAVSTWISTFGVSRNVTAWRQVSSKPDMIGFHSTSSTHTFTSCFTVSSSMKLPPHDVTEQWCVDYADMMTEQQRSHMKRKGTKDGGVLVSKQKKSKKQRVNSGNKAENKCQNHSETPSRKAKKRKVKKPDSGGVTARVRQGGENRKGNLEGLRQLGSIEAKGHRMKVRPILENSHGMQHSSHPGLNVQENEMQRDRMIKVQYNVKSPFPTQHKKTSAERISECGTNSSLPCHGNREAKGMSKQAARRHENRLLDKDQGQNGSRALPKITIYFTKLISRVNKGARFTRQIGNISIMKWLQRSDVKGDTRLDRPGYTGPGESCTDTRSHEAGCCENIMGYAI